MDYATIARFVRDTLGCGCPDEVFRNMRIEAADGLHDGAIDVGGRLLVLLLRAEGGRAVAERLPQLLAQGRRRRDAEGYNRVRFVVATRDDALGRNAQTIFDISAALDARTHLHVIAPESLPI